MAQVIYMTMNPVVAALSFVLTMQAVTAGGQTRDLTNISLEELINIRVTSVSKREQDLFGTPSAVFVLTNEAIRRSGVTSHP